MEFASRQLGKLVATICIALLVHALPARANQVILGAEDDAGPWSYADGSGYVNDVVKAAFQEVGWEAQWKVIPYSRCKALAISGKLAGCFSVSKTPELESALLFPKEPVLSVQNLLIARADSPRDGCTSAAWGGQTLIGLVRGYEYTAAVNALHQDSNVRIDYADSEVSNLRKLKAGRIDATVVTVDQVKRLDDLAHLANISADFKMACNFGALAAYVAFSHLHEQGANARAAFDEGYARLVKRGAISALQMAWRGRALEAMAAKPH